MAGSSIETYRAIIDDGTPIGSEFELEPYEDPRMTLNERAKTAPLGRRISLQRKVDGEWEEVPDVFIHATSPADDREASAEK